MSEISIRIMLYLTRSHFKKTINQHYMVGPNGINKEKKRDLEKGFRCKHKQNGEKSWTESEQHRTELHGGSLMAAYAPRGVTGLSK